MAECLIGPSWLHLGLFAPTVCYLGCEHVSNSIEGALEEESPHQEANQHNIGEHGAEVHNLRAKTKTNNMLFTLQTLEVLCKVPNWKLLRPCGTLRPASILLLLAHLKTGGGQFTGCVEGG